jgi:hypothetical protein
VFFTITELFVGINPDKDVRMVKHTDNTNYQDFAVNELGTG